MKSKNKTPEINSVDELMCELVSLERKVNLKVPEHEVRVEQGPGSINVNLDGKVVFSMSVNDGNASRAFIAFKSAIERAQKSVTPKYEGPEASVLFDALPPSEGLEKFKAEMEKLAAAANARLVERLGQDAAASAAIGFVYGEAETAVRSGETEIGKVSGTDLRAVKKAKALVWNKVDELKRQARENHEAEESRAGNFSEKLAAIVKTANEKLAEIGEAEMTVEEDSVGVYVSAGRLAVCSLPKGVGSAGDALAKVGERIKSFVNETVGVVGRRKMNAQRAEDLKGGCEWDLAMLERANLSDDKESVMKEPWKYGPCAESSEEIVSAAKNAAKAFNTSIRHKFEELDEEVVGGIRMKVSGYTRGVVVSFGDEACFVTNFPLVGNNATVTETAAYVGTTVKAIGDSRIEFYEKVCAETSRKNKLKELAERKDALMAEITAMAM